MTAPVDPRDPQDAHARPGPFKPDWAPAPGAYLRAELDARGMTQAQLATRMTLSAKHVNQMIQGVVGISPDVAVLLERVLGVSSSIWTRLEALHQDARSRQNAAEKLAAYEEWAHKFDRRTLDERGVIKSFDSATAVTEKLLRFFQVADPIAFDAVWLSPSVAFRRSQAFPIDVHATAVWLRLVEIEAEAREVEAFSLGKLRKALPKLGRITALPFKEGFREAQTLFAGAGVRLVLVPEVAKTRVCGATRWLAANQPVIAVTTRHKFLDMIWFAIAHEAGHLALHSRHATFVHLDGKPGDDRAEEAEADAFAAETLLPRSADQEVRALRSLAQAEKLAERYQVDVSIVTGRYGHLTDNWRTFGNLRKRVALESTWSHSPV